MGTSLKSVKYGGPANSGQLSGKIERMSLPVHINAHSGYRANGRPRQFMLDEQVYGFAAVLDQWYES
jgi:hypothetical protein